MQSSGAPSPANMNDPKIIVAMDVASAEEALALAARLSPDACRLKVGKELFVSAGPGLVSALHDRGFGVFLDLKFHDIPNTVAQACAAAARLGVWMVNVHALGGRRMLEAARDALERTPSRPRLIAVTILTSLAADDLTDIGLVDASPAHAALRLAALTQSAGLDGVVCSAQEAAALRAQCGPAFELVTPGIRPADSSADDQARIMTPRAAMAAGSSYLVIGRPITKAADPVEALKRITAELTA
jgi:orotidine-5'-phosphate decarboxylase